MTSQTEKLEIAQRALEAIENCLKHARLDDFTVKKLKRAARYETARIARIKDELPILLRPLI